MRTTDPSDLPETCNGMAFVEVRVIDGPTGRARWVIGRCACGVLCKVPPSVWRAGRWKRCGGCAREANGRAGAERWKKGARRGDEN